MNIDRLLLPGILFILLASLNPGCSGGSDPVTPGDLILRYVTVDVCAACHVQKSADWAMTSHYRALTDLQLSTNFTETCLPCHTTGLDGDLANSGYDDPNSTVAARYDGVQCEACHGPGSRHIVDREAFDSELEMPDAMICGACHAGSNYPVYTEWLGSAHATAIDARIDRPYFTAECLECHSADYRLAEIIPEDATVWDYDYSLTCVTCHDPHRDTYEHQLRKNATDLCIECHTFGDVTPGDAIHHPHSEMFLGIGGYEYPGQSYENTAHTIIEDACIACHMWSTHDLSAVPDDTPFTGHTWEPLLEACRECHAGLDTFDRLGAQTQIQNLLDELKGELDAATANDQLTLNYIWAQHNYNFVLEDGSLGMHNTRYARALLEDSIADFQPGL